ncbi:MAG: hypothetical protein SPJ34_06755 [Candidatus Ornithospirochaeta sp.]|nr:hypothetical protein [Candidatus Ornithospirochaeta sp.]
MKKIAIALFLLLFVSLSAFPSMQKYYELSSEEWKTVSWLCTYAGVAGPPAFGPVTGYQLSYAIDRAAERLGENDEDVAHARSLLGPENAFFRYNGSYASFSFSASPEMYYQTDPANEIGSSTYSFFHDDWFIARLTERRPMAELRLTVNAEDAAWGQFALNAQKQLWDRGIFSKAFDHNISSRRTENFPFESGVSVGTRNLSLIAGRAGVSLGEGYTGNTAIGDNFDYQEFVKAGFFSRNFGVYLNLTHFDSSRDPHSANFPLVDDPFYIVSSRFSGYHQIRHAPLFELYAFDRVRFSLSFMNLIDSDSAFDIRLLNPFAMLHGMFNYKDYMTLESNNMMTLDLSFALARKWKAYFQFTLDQSQQRNEIEGHEDYIEPNAYGGMVNLTYSDKAYGGMVNAFIEAVYTSPCLYLNTKYYDSEGRIVQRKPYPDAIHAWSQDWLVGYFVEKGGPGDISWSGYRYGPDAIVISLGASYSLPDVFTVSASVMYMAHGEKGRGTDPERYSFDDMATVERINMLSPTGIAEHTLALSLEGDFRLCRYFSIHGGAAYAHRWNYRNESGVSRDNVQLMLGCVVSYSI